MRLSQLTLWLVAGSAAAGTAAPALAATALVPHRAVYDLALDTASERSGITGLSGRMVYEFNGSACEGYTVTFRFVTRIDTREVSRLTDQQTTTYEEGDGKSFSFVTKSFVDQNPDREVRGKASVGPDGLKVDLDKPSEAEHEFAVTQFPTQHLIELIGKANGGETFYETTLFDGSEDADKVMTTTVIIGKEEGPEGGDPESKAIAPIAREHFWPVDIAYFDLATEEGEELPEYRISFKLHENGVTRDLTMDYGDFSMTGKLVDLALYDMPKPCGQ
ncbi:MAG: cell envelope integrity EipB family protein [Rhizobiaceae bacterium]